MLLVFSSIFIVLINISGSAKKEQDRRLLSNMAQIIGEEIRLAASMEEGYRREFEIPDTLSEINFSVALLLDPLEANHSEVVLRAVNYSYEIEVVETLPENINGQIYKGKNIICKRDSNVTVNTEKCN